MDKQTLIKSMYLIGKSFEKFTAHEDKELILMWFDVFKDEDDLLFQTAVKRLITTFEYAVPTIANLNHIIAKLKLGERSVPGDIYDEIMNAVRYQIPTSQLSEIAQNVIRGMGGMQRIGLSTNIDFDRTQILKMAEMYIDRFETELLLTNSMKKEQLENRDRLLQLTNKILEE